MERSLEDKCKDPVYLMNTMVEYYGHKGDVGYFSDMCPENITQSFMLDSYAIEKDGGFRAMSYFDDSWQTSISRGEEDDAHLDALRRVLEPAMRKNGEILKRVQNLMCTELKEWKWPQELWMDKATSQQAIQLAHCRWKRMITLSPRHRDNAKDLKTQEFLVFLNTLHCGYSDIVDHRRLTIRMDTSFHDFLWILQEKTALCMIPPRDLVKPAKAEQSDLSRESSKTISACGDSRGFLEEIEAKVKSKSSCDVQRPVEFLVETQSTRAKQYQKAKGSLAIPETTINQVYPYTRSQKDRGYTLNDGPWRYKIMVFNSLFSDITNENDYQEMLKAVKAHAEKTSAVTKLVVIHSLDRQAWTLGKNRKKAEDDEYNSHQGNQNTLEVEGFFDNPGERFMDRFEKRGRLKSVVARQRKPADYSSSSIAESTISATRSSPSMLSSSPVRGPPTDLAPSTTSLHVNQALPSSVTIHAPQPLRYWGDSPPTSDFLGWDYERPADWE